MAEPTFEFIAERLERIQTEQTAMRADMAEMRLDIKVLGTLYLRLERGIEQIKDVLGRVENRVIKLETTMENRISKLEDAAD